MRRLLWFGTDEWRMVKQELRVRRRQERFRYWRTQFGDPPEFNAALRADDRAVHRHNLRRAVIIYERQFGRDLFRRAFKAQHRERWILARTPKALKPVVAWALTADITRRQLRQAIVHATRPVPEKRQFTQARNFFGARQSR